MLNLKQAWRNLGRRPTFVVGALLILSVALAATATVFEVFRAVVARPYPYADPSHVGFLYARDTGSAANREAARGSAGAADIGLSIADAADLKRQSRTVRDLALLTPFAANVTGVTTSFQVRGASVTPNFLTVLGVTGVTGSGFQPTDGGPSGAAAVLLSESAWRTRWGGDPAVIGATIRLDDVRYTVRGVIPASFEWPDGGPFDLFRAAQPQPDPLGRARRFWTGVVRLDGPIAAARTELVSLADGLQRQYPATNRNISIALYSPNDLLGPEVRRALWLIIVAVGLLVSVAVANLVGLQVVEGLSRRRELATRLSLGASPTQLVGDAIAQAALIGVLSCALATCGAWWALRVLAASGPAIPRLHSIALRPESLVFLATCAGAAILVLGVAPRLLAGLTSSAGLQSRRSTADRRTRLVTSAAVIVQLSLAVGLAGIGGLLLRAARELGRVDKGFDSAAVLSFHVPLSRQQREPATAARVMASVQDRLAELPGVVAVGGTLQLPLDGFDVDMTQLHASGMPPVPREREPAARLHVVTPGYFSAMGIRVLDGRAFSRSDDADAPAVAIVNRALAQRLWAESGRPIGKTVTQRLLLTPGEPDTRVVVGVVDDVRHFNLDRPPEPQLYVPHGQSPWPAMNFVVRSPLPLSTLAGLAREAVSTVDPQLPVERIKAMDAIVRGATDGHRLRAGLVTFAALVALGCALVGLASVMAYAVNQRQREIGIRMAVGATQADIGRMIATSAALLSGMGLAGGVLLMAATTQVFRAQFHAASVLDRDVIAAIVVAVTACTAIATRSPLRRAITADPARILRAD